MPELIDKSSKKVGLPPGSLVYTGEETGKVKIKTIEYDDITFQEKESETVDECLPIKGKPTITWINIEGVHQADVIEKIGKYFEIHPLVLEDIMNTEQRPKVQNFENYMFIVLKSLYLGEKCRGIAFGQISLIFGENFVLSLHERGSDIFNPIIERIRKMKNRTTKMGADHLAYSLIDAIVDKYFIILEELGEKIEVLEEELITGPTPNTMKSVHNLREELLFLHKPIWPLREMITNMQGEETPLISDSTRLYLRDVHDHIVRVIDTMETFRDTTSGMLDVYLSSVSNKTNEIMKILTIVTTIFIPLSFIAGVYGMNFLNMPELRWELGYPLVLLSMAISGAVMLVYFKRKKWI